MRKMIVPIVAAAGVLAIPVAVMAASGGANSSLDLQASKFTTSTATTSSKTFHTIPDLSGLTICALHQMTATLNVKLNRAPASFQVRIDEGGTMQPRTIRFVPAGAHDSFAFTFMN